MSVAEVSNDHGFSPPQPYDERPWLWLAALLSCVYSLLSLAARLTSKWDMLWWDDTILGVGYVIAVGHWGTIYDAISNGLGTAVGLIDSSEVSVAAKDFFAARILLLIALGFSKISVLAFSRRIFSGNLNSEKIIFGTVLSLSMIWTILAPVLSSAGCDPDLSLVANPTAMCSSQTARWIVIITLDVLTELSLLAIPVWFVSKGQMKASKKRVVAFVFAFRLVCAGFAIATAVSYFNFLNGGESTSNLGISPVVAWQEVLLATSLISASIPSLRSFLWAFMSREMWAMYGIDSKQSPQNSMRGSVPMRSFNRSGRSQQDSTSYADEENVYDGSYSKKMSLRPAHLQYSVDVGRGAPTAPKEKRMSGSGRSDNSEQMIIHRNIDFEQIWNAHENYLFVD